jgi:hypothetical protein
VTAPAAEPFAADFAGLLRRHLAARAGEPFLVARGARGHFRWISLARAVELCDGAAPRAPEEETAAAWLRQAALSNLSTSENDTQRALGGAGSGGPEIWISHREPLAPGDLRLAGWAARTGAVVLREPAPRVHPALFAWARPTLLAGTPREVAELLEGFAAEAPRLGNARWRRRRLDRLRAVLVATEEDAALESTAAALAALGAAAARVLPFPDAGW